MQKDKLICARVAPENYCPRVAQSVEYPAHNGAYVSSSLTARTKDVCSGISQGETA